MSETNIGGFFAALGIKVDRDSFDKAGRAIDNTSNSLNHLITTLKAAATAMGIDKLTAMESQELYTAEAIGISAEELDKWQIAASLAGAKTAGLTQSLAKLNNAFQDTKRGIVNESIAKDLSQLGLNWNSMEGLDAGQRMAMILDAASKQQDQGLALRLVNSLLGSDGQQMYQFMMKNYGGDVNQLLQKASLLDFTTPETKNNSAEFQKELGELKTTVAEIAKLGIGELAGPLADIVKPLNEWLQTHGDEITAAMVTLGEKAQYLADKVQEMYDFYKGREEVLKTLQSSGATDQGMVGGFNLSGIYLYDDLSEEMQKMVDADPEKYAPYVIRPGTYGESNKEALVDWFKGVFHIQDGIISPDGTVTQVAPDDWVIAAKDLSNIGAAFMPQVAQSSGDVILNQTINVNGNASPSTVRQQAYVGARSGLLEAIEQSTNRLQLMPQAR